MNKKVLIIGGTGYIGYHVCKELVAKNYEVTALSFDDVPKGFLPDVVKIIKCNINDISDDELSNIFKGHYGFIFAAGADDRIIPDAPAYDFFYKANVLSIKRLLTIARVQKIEKVVVLNSYFAYFNRIWPEMKLAEKHPYIRSRKEQQEMAFSIGDASMPVAVIELPYIVGTTPTKGSLWKPLVKYANSKGNTKFYTKGGTSVVSVRNVGLALANAMEVTTKNTIYQVGDVNMTWQEWLQALVQDPNKKLKVVTIPKFLLKIGMWLLNIKQKFEGKESGLKMTAFVDLQTKETFLPLEESKAKLKYGKYDIREDFRDTIELCMKIETGNS